jgi:structure-specific recognition protein 1
VRKDGVSETVASRDMRGGRLMRVARGFQLRIEQKTGGFATFEGFTADDAERLRSFFREHFQIDLADQALSLKGWNWGKYSIDGNAFSLVIDDKLAYEIPLNAVAKASSLRYETTIEFHQVRGMRQ